MDQLTQLQQLIALDTPTLEIQPIVDSLAQKLAATGSEKLTEAISTLASMGIDPQLYIPVSRQAMRNQRERSRLEIERAAAVADEKRKQELHEIEILGLRQQLSKLNGQPVTA